MTRINAFIPPADLCDKHLLAEHREIVRIPNQIKTGKLSTNDIPESFRLGTGHVKFFADKLCYLYSRYLQILNECKLRGFNVTDMGSSFVGVPNDLFNIWSPNDDEVERIQSLLIDRIVERMPKNAKHTKH